MCLKHLVLFFTVYTPIGLGAQSYFDQFITTKEGLPSMTVYSLAEDADGQIWMGTKNGLVRYDGNKMQVFTASEGIEDNEVLSVNHTVNNEMVVVSFLDKFSFGHQFQFYKYDHTIKKSKLSQYVFEVPKTPYRNPTIINNAPFSYFVNLQTYNHRIYEVRNQTIIDPRRRYGLDSNIKLWNMLQLDTNEFIFFGKYKDEYISTAFHHCDGKTKLLPLRNIIPDLLTKSGNIIYLCFKDTIYAYRMDIVKQQIIPVNKLVCSYNPHKLVIINNRLIPLNRSGISDEYDTLLHKVKDKSVLAGIQNISDIHSDMNENIWISSLTEGVILRKKT